MKKPEFTHLYLDINPAPNRKRGPNGPLNDGHPTATDKRYWISLTIIPAETAKKPFTITKLACKCCLLPSAARILSTAFDPTLPIQKLHDEDQP